eukprot:Nitzschia sp. Nitz4//scaffold107_size73032//53030//53878//NITZ4_005767-RA/size73032-processed-gene-0.112-mRNA-1//1//CDS//3329532614//4225//frame0
MPHIRCTNRRMTLLTKLAKIQDALDPSIAESAMSDFAMDLLQLSSTTSTDPSTITASSTTSTTSCNSYVFSTGDETLLQDLHSNGALAILLHVMQRFQEQQKHHERGGASAEFFNSATIALVHLSFGSKSRTKHLYDLGALEVIHRMMQEFRTTDYVQIIGIALLTVLGRNTTIRKEEMERLVWMQVVQAMEYNPTCSSLYVVACTALGVFMDPSSTFRCDCALVCQILKAVASGLVHCMADPMAYGVGFSFLSTMLGQEAAYAMLADVEGRQGTFLCAAAA